MTASVPSGTDQSSRANPPAVVSPDTPAFATLTANPLALSARCNCAGNASLAARPYPAVSESPNATILTMRSAAHGYVVTSAMPAPRAHRPMTAASHPPLFIRRENFPYDRGGLAEPHQAKRRRGNPIWTTPRQARAPLYRQFPLRLSPCAPVSGLPAVTFSMPY